MAAPRSLNAATPTPAWTRGQAASSTCSKDSRIRLGQPLIGEREGRPETFTMGALGAQASPSRHCGVPTASGAKSPGAPEGGSHAHPQTDKLDRYAPPPAAGAPQHPSPSRLAPSAGPERGALGLGAGNSQAAGRGRTPWGPSPVPARLSWLGRPAGLAWAGAPTAVGCSARRVTAFCTQAGASPHACSYHLDLSQYRCQLRPAAVTVQLVLHAGRGDLCPQGTRGQARGLSPVPVGAALASGGRGAHRTHTAAAGVRAGPCPQGHFRRAVWVSPAPASRPICTGSQGCREAHDQVQSGPGQPRPPSTAPGS